MSWTARIAVILLWVAATAAIAFFVARAAASDDDDDAGSLIAPPIEQGQRQTALLEQHTIQPVISGDGIVVADADGVSWYLEAPVSPQSLAYQLLQDPVSVKALIVGGPAGFECAWLGLGQGAAATTSVESARGDGGRSGGGVTMRCRIPEDVQVVAGLSGTMVLAISAPVDTLALPVTAVVGGAQQGQVIAVAPDGTQSIRQVGLGIADTFWIEITSGLQPGEMVLAAPVQADFGVDPR